MLFFISLSNKNQNSNRYIAWLQYARGEATTQTSSGYKAQERRRAHIFLLMFWKALPITLPEGVSFLLGAVLAVYHFNYVCVKSSTCLSTRDLLPHLFKATISDISDWLNGVDVGGISCGDAAIWCDNTDTNIHPIHPVFNTAYPAQVRGADMNILLF